MASKTNATANSKAQTKRENFEEKPKDIATPNGGGGDSRERQQSDRPDRQDRQSNRQDRPDRQDRNRGGNRGGNQHQHDRNSGSSQKDPIREKLASASGSTTYLQTKEGNVAPKKFTGRCRLFVGNLSNSITEADFRKMFEEYGEVSEIFLNVSKGFGFVKLDTRPHAEAAKVALDFSMHNGKYLRVRFATHGAALKVKNLPNWVSNELLEASFSIFGEVERAVVVVDDRGRPVGEGIVEYSRKQAAQTALKRCLDGCFLLTGSPRPVLVEVLEQRDEDDGLPEKNFQKNNSQYMQDRDKGPRLAEPGSFEHDFAMRWKKLYEVERQKRQRLEQEIIEARQQLEDQQEYAVYEHQANVLREKLRAIEEQNSMFQREREMRNVEERRRDEQRRAEEKMIRQQEEEILRRRNGGGGGGGNMGGAGLMGNVGGGGGGNMGGGLMGSGSSMVEDMRRRQEDSMLMQASALSDILDRQEAALRGSGEQTGLLSGFEMGPNGPGGPNNKGGPNQNQMQQMMQRNAGGGGGQGGGGQGGGGQAMGMAQQRPSRFDQPNSGPGGPNMNQGNNSGMGGNNPRMGGPNMGGRGGGNNNPGGNNGPRDMMDRGRRDMMDDYGMDAKRRRF